MPNSHNSISLETAAPQSRKKTDVILRDSAEAVIWTLETPASVVWTTELEEFLGWKYVAILQQLVWKKKQEYITLVTNVHTFKPLLSGLMTRSQISKKVNVSRVIAYIKANIS